MSAAEPNKVCRVCKRKRTSGERIAETPGGWPPKAWCLGDDGDVMCPECLMRRLNLLEEIQSIQENVLKWEDLTISLRSRIRHIREDQGLAVKSLLTTEEMRDNEFERELQRLRHELNLPPEEDDVLST